jgi:hypothetical protein
VPPEAPDLTRWCRISALLGGLAWLGLLYALPDSGTVMDAIARLLLLAVLVFVPLGLALAPSPGRGRSVPLLYAAAQRVQPLAAAFAVASFFLPTGLPAALCAAVWLAFTGLVALGRLAHVLRTRRRLTAEEACVDAALLYLPVGGVWLCLARGGVRPLAFADVIVLLTAIHFHYSGFALPILAGRVGRHLVARGRPAWPAFRFVAASVILGTPLIAAGISASPVVEVAGVVLLVAGLWALALLTLVAVVPRLRPRRVQGLLAVSALALLGGMLLAGLYAVSKFAGAPLLDIPRMVALHGGLNALGFVLCGLLGWTWAPLPLAPSPGASRQVRGE